MRIAELDTPALLVDLDVMERNLARVAAYARGHGLRLRPHTKTHKIPALARRQLALGAAGVTVAKVGEAEVMLGAAPGDMLVAYPVLGARKLQRLMQVARRTRLTVALDSLEAARQLSEAAVAAGVRVAVLTEIDVGLRRVGVPPGEPIRQLSLDVSKLPQLDWEGIAFYPGHIKRINDEGIKALDELSGLVKQTVEELKQAGLAPRIVSGGSTPTLWESHRVAGMNEIRPGTYIFNDRNTVACGACAWEDCAASILVTVVSTAVPGQVIVDGGSKTFSTDRLVTGDVEGFGRVVEAPEAVFTRMNEEHGYVDVRQAGRRFAVGDRLRIIPNHICVAVNLHERVFGVRGEEVEAVWEVEGRGKLQ